jgi:hypothetical protein
MKDGPGDGPAGPPMIAFFRRVDEWVHLAPVSLVMAIFVLGGVGLGAVIGLSALAVLACR